MSNFLKEWKARRAGRKGLDHDIRRSARDIIGPTGSMFSSGWDVLADKGEKYVESLEPDRVPPSEFVSKRDRTRWNMPIPLRERILEDWHKADDDPDVDFEDLAENDPDS